MQFRPVYKTRLTQDFIEEKITNIREVQKDKTNAVILTKIEKEDIENKELFKDGVFSIPNFVPGTKIPIIGINSNVIDGIDTIKTKFSLDDDEDEFPNNITKIVISSNVEKIGSFLFRQCKNLQEFYIPEKLEIGIRDLNNWGIEISWKTTLPKIIHIKDPNIKIVQDSQEEKQL